MSSYGALNPSENGKQVDRKKAFFLVTVAVLGAVLMVQMVRYGTSEAQVNCSFEVAF